MHVCNRRMKRRHGATLLDAEVTGSESDTSDVKPGSLRAVASAGSLPVSLPGPATADR